MAALPLPRIDEGKYEILQRIREGGMGALYKVRHRHLDQVRVIKVIRPQFADSGDMQRRFEREAQAAARLIHPNIAQLLDFNVDPDDGFAYMVMEFIDGATLEETLAKSGSIAVELTLEIARQGLRALGYLHAQGYVHRDIAPDNLMLTKDQAGMPLIKLIDLGIVKHLAKGAEKLTGANFFLGKVRYASPEQCAGGDLDSRSDIYSFGVMLYELLTGTYPFEGTDVSQLSAAHLFQPARSFDQTDPERRVPDDIREVVLLAMEKSREKRFATAEKFLELLSRRPTSQSVVMDLEQTLSTTIEILQRGVEEAPRATAQDRERRKALARSVDEVEALVRAEKLDQAVVALEAATSRFGGRVPLLRALHPRIKALRRQIEDRAREHSRQEEIAGVASAVESLLEQERVDEARRALAASAARLGAGQRFDELATRIAAAEAALVVRRNQAEAERLRVQEERRSLAAKRRHQKQTREEPI